MEFMNKVIRQMQLNRYTHLIVKGIKLLTKYGISVTWQKVKQKIRNKLKNRELANRSLYTEAELKFQREEIFSRDIKFSILVPLYNTPKIFLREMIQSVLDQTYANWELCLADGSDAEHGDVEKICMGYVREDKRVCYQKLRENKGISGNTNACIDMATGDYIALFDHDDILHPAALHDVMKEICEKNADFVYTDEAVFESPDLRKIITFHFKPDFAVDNLRGNNYICHLSVFSREVLEKAGSFRSDFDGSQDHDLILRLTHHAERIVHIPKILYYWRSHPLSVAQDISVKTYAIKAGQNAVKSSLNDQRIIAEVESSKIFPAIYRIKYELNAEPKVSILIVNRNNFEKLSRCVKSILEKTTYKNYEIIIVDNGSDDAAVLAYYDELKNKENISVYIDQGKFTATLNNYAADKATGAYYLFLHSDTEVITPEWIEEMLMYVQRDDVAAVGAKLYYPNNTIQHAGVILGMGKNGVSGNIFRKCVSDEVGYMGRLWYSQNMSAVSDACMMVKAEAYWEAGGFDEAYIAAYGDTDLCMRLRKKGYLIVWTPYTELYHYESTASKLISVHKKQKQFEQDAALFKKQWTAELNAGDPYSNPNLELEEGYIFPM